MKKFNTPSNDDFKGLSISEKRTLFLNDAIKYYTENVRRRAVNEYGNCQYRAGERACALGRYIPERDAKRFDSYDDADARSVFNELPKVLKDLGEDFLMQVQILHDRNEHWNLGGLTEEGKVKLKDIRDFYITE